MRIVSHILKFGYVTRAQAKFGMNFEGYGQKVVVHNVQLVSKGVTQQCMMPLRHLQILICDKASSKILNGF